MKMIEVKNLSKRYRNNSFYSLKDVSFSISKGEIVGLIGKNGAGKSTLLKLMAKSLRPTSGTVLYQGKDIYQHVNILTDFGIMIEPVFYPYLTVEENICTYLEIYHQKSDFEDILKLVDLWDVRKRKPGSFSFGMKQRTALALALSTKPKVLLLDEPFVGLDPVGVNNLIEILKRWSKQFETSMLISSHQLSELESVCNRNIWIEGGRLKEQRGNRLSEIVIELNANVDNEIINNLIQKYDVSILNHKLLVQSTMNNISLNEILQALSTHKMVKDIRQAKEKLFVEVSHE